MTERAITEAIIRWLRSQGAHVIKTYGGPYRRGLPDLIGVYRGRALALEVKRPGGKPTPLQEHELGRWEAAGAVAGVVTSIEDIKRLLEEVTSDDEQVCEICCNQHKQSTNVGGVGGKGKNRAC